MKSKWLILSVTLVAVLLAVMLRPRQAYSQLNGVQSGLLHFLPVIFGETGSAAGTPTPEATATATAGATATAVTCAPTDGLIRNPGFESGETGWSFFTDGKGTFQTGSPAHECKLAAQLTLQQVAKNTQFYQSGFRLNAGSLYRLSFSAYSSSGKDVQVFVQQHSAPYQSFGLGTTVDLGRAWQRFNVEFAARGFGNSTTDTRLRFWFPRLAGDGDVYWLDDIRLEEIGAAPTATPGPTNTPRPTRPTNTPAPAATNTPVPGATNTPVPRPSATPRATATSAPGGQELLVFNLNRKVTEADRGFPYDQPPIANGNWVTPVNYANGTLYYRIEVRSQPKAQDMKIQFCFWQEKNGNRFALENCGPQQDVRGTAGTVETWSVKVQDMWKLNGQSIEWNRARYRNGMAIKNSKGLPVSNYNGWNWNGENPKNWYPLDISFKVVVVAPGAQFSGWENYIDD